jgi:signal transduction histidine kinase
LTGEIRVMGESQTSSRGSSALIPADENQRLAAVLRYDILDTPPDGAFDRVTALAARILDVPISTITIVDHDRIWFKSAHGVDVQEIPRDPGLCASAILNYQPWIVENAEIDPRTLSNPLVAGELGLRFYVGVPLTTSDGHNLGTLNVIDAQPRSITEQELDTLKDLAAIVIDELELRLAARTAVKLQVAEEAAETRERIIAGISHEMQTPLAILGLIADTAADWPDEQQEIRETMVRHVRTLQWLVQRFLDYSQLALGRSLDLRPQPTDIGIAVAELPRVLARQAAIEIEVPEATPPVLADPSRLQQILMNLTSSALKASSSEAPVTVSIQEGETDVSVVLSSPGNRLGPDEIESLFDPPSKHGDASGDRLGLYVTRALVDAMGGRIEVVSDSDPGTRFHVTLPRADR